MLYLLKLDNAYKIGYSTDIDTRFKTISSTHVYCELISTKFGSLQDEKELHKLCEEYFIKNELFLLDDNVVRIFNLYICKHLQKGVNDYNKNRKRIAECIQHVDDILEIAQNFSERANQIEEHLIKLENKYGTTKI